MDSGELYDDGNTTSGDGCDATCTVIETGYACDQGPAAGPFTSAGPGSVVPSTGNCGPDCDGDGILDVVECPGINYASPSCGDSDGDGIPDYLDQDSDNDGIPDSFECGSTSPCPDTDGDGTPDYLDIDSDGDGVNDVTEAGGVDAGNGQVSGWVDNDGDGWDDNSAPLGSAAGLQNSDGDGQLDFLDVDDDNDGVLTVQENTIDANGNGVLDYLESDQFGSLQLTGDAPGCKNSNINLVWILLGLFLFPVRLQKKNFK